MTVKPDAGAIVAQTAVPILPDDTAFEVFGKVTVAAEQTLWGVLPALLDGTAPRQLNDLRGAAILAGASRTAASTGVTCATGIQPAPGRRPALSGAFTEVNDVIYIIETARLSKRSGSLPARAWR